MTVRKVCIITGTRAEWGLLSPIACALDERPDVELQVIATNMHLMEKYGMTVHEIEADGITVTKRVPLPLLTDSEADTARTMAACMKGMADAFESLTPDLAVILGDRTEMLAAAAAATAMRIPIVHISGGEVSEGAIDDSIRHAITKLSSLHLVSTEQYRHRVIQMGENPQNVINTGSIGVYNAIHEPVMLQQELEQSIGMPLDRETLLVTYHPATLDEEDVASRFQSLLDALDEFPHCKLLFTYPNNDARGAVIIKMIQEYAARCPYRATAVPSLGKRRYLSALHYIGAVVGNSSSGIIEVPSLHIPTVNIGIRQHGRMAAKSVIHCGDSTSEIVAAVNHALSPEGRLTASECDNPYGGNDTLARTVEAIASTPIKSLKHKRFYDIPF